MTYVCKSCGQTHKCKNGFYNIPSVGPICCECYDKIVQPQNKGNYGAVKDIQEKIKKGT